MKQRIKDLFRKAYNILFRKETRRTIWGYPFYSQGNMSAKGNPK